METTAPTPTSLPSEPPMGTQTRIEGPLSGEFAKILRNQPAQADNPDEKPLKGQEENQQSATTEEVPLLLSWLPTLLPEGKSPLGKNELPTAFAGSQILGNEGAPQILPVPIPAGGTKDGSTGVFMEGMLSEKLPSSPEKSFNLKLSPNTNNTTTNMGTLPVDLPAEIPIPGNGGLNSLRAENARNNNLEMLPWHNSDGSENAWEDLKISAKVELTNFNSGFWTKEANLFQNDFNSADTSKAGNTKTGDLPGSLAAPLDGSAAPHSTGKIRLEGIPGSDLSRKPEVYEQVSQKMLWSFSQNEEKFRLILDPPHLGSIYMEIQRDKEQVKATLWAENPQAKQILDSNQISIQKIIESEGFSLESFNVFVEQDLGAFQENRERMRNPEPATANPAAEANREPSGGATVPNLVVRESGGRVRAIDLII